MSKPLSVYYQQEKWATHICISCEYTQGCICTKKQKSISQYFSKLIKQVQTREELAGHWEERTLKVTGLIFLSKKLFLCLVRIRSVMGIDLKLFWAMPTT